MTDASGTEKPCVGRTVTRALTESEAAAVEFDRDTPRTELASRSAAAPSLGRPRSELLRMRTDFDVSWPFPAVYFWPRIPQRILHTVAMRPCDGSHPTSLDPVGVQRDLCSIRPLGSIS